MRSEAGQTEVRATHFSHPHPLILLISYQQLPLSNITPYSCSACNLNPSGAIYSCTVCNFFLHKRCFEMPHKISHPFHKEHAFDLLPAPAYAEGVYSCDACQETGRGFSYHCKPCGIDLHILCAATPLSLTSACHPHQLQLHFESPYGDKCFSCDVCRGRGSNHWLYSCNLCGFDAHLKCARGAPPPPVGNPTNQAQAAPVPGSGWPYFVGPAAAATPYNNNAAVGTVPAAAAVSRQNDQLTTQFQAIMQAIHNNHTALAAGIGGGGGGGGGGLQQLTQLISGLNNTGFGGGIPGLNAFGGGGGGGGTPGLNAFGGGGGGQDFVQALINGGGGGLDSLQSLLGGGGGLDFLGGIGGLF